MVVRYPPAVITCRHYREGVLKEEAFDPARVSDLIQEPGARVWLDLADPTEEELTLIQEEFGLHELAMEDTRVRGQRPKVEVYDGYFFLAMHALSLDAEDELVDQEVHAFAGHRFLITLRYDPVFDITEVLRRWDRQTELTYEGGGFLLYALVDEVVDGYFSVIERYEDVGEDLEDEVFSDDAGTDIQERIFKLKRRVVVFRRLVMPLREVLDLMQEQPGFVTDQLRPYYRDVADHVIRTLEFADNLRDLATSALEAQISQVSNKLNIVMKRLTAWASIILVPTLIAGIYGMNFLNMPELKWHYGYYAALGLMGLSMFLLYRMFKKRDYF
ncbi:MAG: magnesium/cobalt transporter CorA [Actinomycetota bacterium]